MTTESDIAGRITFIQEAERLKSVLRSGFTSTGRAESTAEHSWRLCLLAMTFADQLGAIDIAKVLKLCVIHDLGEAISGDVPAVEQHNDPGKSGRERRDLQTLMLTLPAALQAEILSLWEEYEAAQSAEARVVKGLDKLETVIQHNQGANPPDFDYAFNLAYGQKHTATHPVLAQIRALVDQDTLRHAQSRRQAAC